ncbi:MAG: LptE family protein [Paludibacteraceae bacterium]|nr:LptE family protein [Paludibacteraceae bacterium]
MICNAHQINKTPFSRERDESESKASRRRVEGETRGNRSHIVRTTYVLVALLCCACSISYKFNGANINYQTTHSISIADFPNNAPMVNPTLSNNLSEGIRDLYQRQTRLTVLPKGGDLELEGEIVGYDISQGAISADSYASESKLTIRVTVHFTNNIHPEESFDKTYTAYQTFDASRLLSDVQDELCATMITEIAENIYNDTVAKW